MMYDNSLSQAVNSVNSFEFWLYVVPGKVVFDSPDYVYFKAKYCSCSRFASVVFFKDVFLVNCVLDGLSNLFTIYFLINCDRQSLL